VRDIVELDYFEHEFNKITETRPYTIVYTQMHG